MEYNQLIESARKLNFIGNEERADAAVKATLGILASSMKEEDAKEFTSYFPEPLTFEKLRSHQVNENMVSPEEHIQEIATQFNFNPDEARQLVRNVISTTKENLSEEQLKSWEQKLPKGWDSFIERA